MGGHSRAGLGGGGHGAGRHEYLDMSGRPTARLGNANAVFIECFSFQDRLGGHSLSGLGGMGHGAGRHEFLGGGRADLQPPYFPPPFSQEYK